MTDKKYIKHLTSQLLKGNMSKKQVDMNVIIRSV